tara:strand:+ start:275 stop:613 length:339 start_codon:yes stop_codon:yes gene_type:complete
MIHDTMPTAATTPKAPRKRRARKTTSKVTTAKYSQPIAMTMTEEIKAKTRPESTHLSLKDYVEDAKIRWSIHEYEIQELGKDLKVAYQFIVKHSTVAYEYVKESYNRAFAAN